MSMSSTTTTLSPPSQKQIIPDVLKKPSKTLAVCVEYDPSSQGEGNSLSRVDLIALSMQLRKAKVTALWTVDREAVEEFVKEQKSARGNFPGPCPVIFDHSTNEVDDILEAVANAGVTAVVLRTQQIEAAESLLDLGVEVLWYVETCQDVSTVLSQYDNVDGVGPQHSFVVPVTVDNKDHALKVVESIPKGSVIVASLEVMQKDHQELELAKEFKGVGCTAVVMKRAAVGDTEDLEYTRFIVDGMTRKKSSEFNMSGLTGSTNGHFGGVATSLNSTWKRRTT